MKQEVVVEFPRESIRRRVYIDADGKAHVRLAGRDVRVKMIDGRWVIPKEGTK